MLSPSGSRMMRFRDLCIVVLALAVWASGSLAQMPRPSIFAYGGGSLPLAPSKFSDYWRPGYILGGGFGNDIRPNLSISLQLEYMKFPINNKKVKILYGASNLSGGSASLTMLSINWKARLEPKPKPFSPYILFGGGFIILQRSDLLVFYEDSYGNMESSSEGALALDAGVGFEWISARNLGFFVDSRFIMGFTHGEQTRLLPIRMGILL